ncbi:FAD-dependent oxidoreductase [Parendozoicomonas haliclonae]|uniref:Mercuric reductase n=1 Tax=Parendozoicomonas haliclonae TaxID=1960125 RepID=A0A1X7AKU3_9GAMM|nr:FAD-dependent oxidoreductase [Parendozoicomonas haliclonae]SMA48366.1 Mercuric reductase [Parendozoicomonas haliclonae]
MRISKLLLLAVILAALGAFYGLGLSQYLTFEFFSGLKQDNPGLTATIFFLIYVTVTALSLPIASVMTLFGGALFGFAEGLLIISFASTIGATLAMLVSRTLLQDWVQSRFGNYLKTINSGVEKDGAFYLFSLRLIPAVPFMVINLVMGLTRIRIWTYYWVSQLGMLAGTAVYVNAGVKLGQVEEFSVKGIATPELILSFVLLAAFPWVAKGLMAFINSRKVYKPFNKPTTFDTNLAVIGAGSGGLVSAYIAAAVKAKVTLIEKHKMGGDCLNTGCVPSKALIRSSRIHHYVERAEEFGLKNAKVEVDFPAVMERVQNVIKQVEPHDSVERYTGLGVECVQGTATLVSPWEVKTGDKTITAKNIIIASGGQPFVPNIPGLDQVDYYTSDTIWNLREKPERMLVLGGGPIGSELSQAFQRLGVQVIQVDQSERILPREDADVAEAVMAQFRKDGIDLRTSCKAVAFHKEDGRQWLDAEQNGETIQIAFDVVLLAVGRKANTSTLGMENLGLETNPNGTLTVNEYMQTRYPNIYACGDVAGPYQFTHAAAHQAWYAAVNALFGRFKKFKVDYSVMPWATFIDPEVARVGLNEIEAKEQGIAYEVTRFGIDDLDRALADGEAKGFIKVLTVPGKDKILGCTIVGYHAGELITEYITAMKHGLGLNKILGTIHIYPTLSETNKYAAGEWKKAHAPEKVLNLLEKFHRWSRS